MASKVNVKFVVLLSIVLVAIAGATGFLALKVVFKSADDLAARGDAAVAEGDYKAAEVFYSKAVNKDPYNENFLLKWRGALEKWIPDSDRELQTEFSSTYLSLHSQLALANNMANADYQQQHIDLITAMIEMSGFSRPGWESLAETCSRYITTQQALKPDDPSWIGLRRSRGLAWSHIAGAGLEISDEQRTQAEEDLKADLQLRPADYEALESLLIIRGDLAARAEGAGRTAEATRIRDENQQLLRDFIERNGADSAAGAQAAMQLASFALNNEGTRIAAEFGSAAGPKLAELQDRFQEQTRQIADTLLKVPAEQITAPVLRRLKSLESQTNSSRDYAATFGVLERALSASPSDTTLLALKGELLVERKEFQAGIAILDSILAKERLPLGLPGVSLINRKIDASLRKVDASVRAASEAKSAEERDTWLARAKEARTDLVQRVTESAPPVQFLDAKIAALAQDYFTAQRILDAYNQNTSNANPDALWLSANVALQLRQPGNAETAFERILALNPSSAEAHIGLADIEASLGRLDSARDHLQQALKGNPQNPVILRKLAEIQQKLGEKDVTDPIDRAVFDAQRTAQGSETELPDAAGGIEILRKALADNGPDPRLYAELARFLAISGDADQADQIAKQGVAQFPDDQALKQVALFVTSMSSVDEYVKQIMDMQDQPEVEKQLAAYQAYARADRADDALAALKKAEQANPKHPLVIEALFTRAIDAGDTAAAEALAQRAKEADVDHLEGLSYRARLLLLQNKRDDALAAFNQAVQRNPNAASLWRMLADLQLQMGRSGDALTSYQKALAIRPNDLATIYSYCQALIGLNRLDEALDVARRSETTGRTNQQFMDLLLGLEARVGNKPGARDHREKILAARPDDIQNRTALADLYISLGQWDKARALIDETRAKSGESDSLVALDARLYAERNQLENARRVYAKRIAETPPSERIPRYVDLARFMLDRGRSSPAIVALRQAATLQKPGDHAVDVLLADTLMNYGRNAEAATLLRIVINSGGDKEFLLTKRLAECSIRLDRLTEADTLLASIPDGDADTTVVLLKAQTALSRGDAKRARAIADDAVAKWPQDYRVWIMRADAEAASPDLRTEALADLQHAIEMRPNLGDAYRRKAEILSADGRTDEAIAAWRDAVRTNPGDEALRSGLLGIMVQRKMETEAVQMADEWFALHPRDVGLRSRVAELFVQGGMPLPAIHIYQDAFAIEPQPQIVLRLADLLIGGNPPRLADAERVFNDAKTIVPTDPSLLLARARLFALTNRLPAAQNDCLASFRLIRKEADPMAFWYSTLARVFDNPTKTLAFLRDLANEPGGAEWAALFAARAQLSMENGADRGLADLETLVDRTRDPMVRYSAIRALAGNRYNAQRFDDAIQLWKQGLELVPTDWQLENNIAYTLGVELGNYNDALPYALSATQHAPNNPETHDTLGAVYLGLGRAADAVAPLEAAVNAARGTPEDAKYMVRLAQARFDSGDKPGASDLVLEVQALLDKGRKLDDQYTALLEKVRSSVNGN
ncbi:MAG: tetratricopeptide repeat protein [Phycisphaerales bacterium]|nr:tetratricopeptide repeat protein [Phycisphaerales bacterium]